MEKFNVDKRSFFINSNGLFLKMKLYIIYDAYLICTSKEINAGKIFNNLLTLFNLYRNFHYMKGTLIANKNNWESSFKIIGL